LRVNADKIYKKQADAPFGLVVIFGFLVITIPGLFFSGGRSFSDVGTPFYYLFDHVYIPLSATMFALLAFFVASASYRAFRARNVEATMLLLAAFVLMLGRVPIGDWITAWLPEGYRLGEWADWIMDFPQTAGQRAIMIGIALGVVSSALRVILGLERAMGGD
jgi:membrane-bound acyltransferase YfiQ involved in biofilm formation